MTCTIRKCMNYLPWFPSLSLRLRCAVSNYRVVAMQRTCEKYILPALIFNNIIVCVKLQWSVSFHPCIPNYTIATFILLCVEKTWLQKKEVNLHL